MFGIRRLEKGALATILAVLAFASESALAGNHKKQFGGPTVLANDLSFEQMDHSAFHGLLQRFVDCCGQVCYSEWKCDPQSVNQLAAYLQEFGRLDLQRPASRNATMAGYINAYNALTLWGILEAYPLASIQKINAKNAEFRIFDDLELWMGDSYLTINAIENDILRPLGDPRIHFALVCAARGCPRLRNEAYTPHQLDAQLNDNAVEFFTSRQRFQISRLTGTVKLSPILKWYGADFGSNPDEIIHRVFNWLPEEDRRWLATHPGWRLTYLGYDWGLNDQCPTVNVRIGRMPYRIYSKVSPMVAPLLPHRRESSEVTLDNGPPLATDSTPTEFQSSNPPSPPTYLSLPVP